MTPTLGTFSAALRKVSEHRADANDITDRVVLWSSAPVLWLKPIFEDYDREIPTTRERFGSACDHDVTLLGLLESSFHALTERLRGLTTSVSAQHWLHGQHTRTSNDPLQAALERSVRSDPKLEAQKEAWVKESWVSLTHGGFESTFLLGQLRTATESHTVNVGLLLRAADRDLLVVTRVRETVRHLRSQLHPRTKALPKTKGSKTVEVPPSTLLALPRNPFTESGSSWGLPVVNPPEGT